MAASQPIGVLAEWCAITAWNTTTATQAPSASCARLNRSLTPNWRSLHTSATAGPTMRASTRPAGLHKARPSTRGISLSDEEYTSR